jgi:hypothetical protein
MGQSVADTRPGLEDLASAADVEIVGIELAQREKLDT